MIIALLILFILNSALILTFEVLSTSKVLNSNMGLFNYTCKHEFMYKGGMKIKLSMVKRITKSVHLLPVFTPGQFFLI